MSKHSSLGGGLTVAIAVAALALLTGCYSGAGCCMSPCCDPCPAPNPCCPATCGPCAPCGAACGPACPPADAKPGEAWCRVFVPPQYEETECQVCTCPATCEREWVEPVYEDRARQVCCKPASCVNIPVPAEYADESYEVVVCPARTEWKRVDCASHGLQPGEEQGECWVLCEVPEVKQTCTRRVCTKPASCRQEAVPAEYQTVTERVCVTPGYYKTHEVPAQYETRKDRRCVCPGRWEWRMNPDCQVPEGCAPSAPAAGDLDS